MLTKSGTKVKTKITVVSHSLSFQDRESANQFLAKLKKYFKDWNFEVNEVLGQYHISKIG
jgi:hypothetical protein